jgi:hypothetical protein
MMLSSVTSHCPTLNGTIMELMGSLEHASNGPTHATSLAPMMHIARPSSSMPAMLNIYSLFVCFDML